MVRSGEFMSTYRDRKVSSPSPSFLPFLLQTMRISPGTRRIVSVVQVAVPSTEASIFPGKERKRVTTAVTIFITHQGMDQ